MADRTLDNLAKRCGLARSDFINTLGIEQRDLSAMEHGWALLSEPSIQHIAQRLTATGHPVRAQEVFDLVNDTSQRSARPPFWLREMEDEARAFCAANVEMPDGAIHAALMQRFPSLHYDLDKDAGFRLRGWQVQVEPPSEKVAEQ